MIIEEQNQNIKGHQVRRSASRTKEVMRLTTWGGRGGEIGI